LESLNQEYGTHKKFDHDTHEALIQYDWPGNVRELKNVVHRAVLMSDNEIHVDKACIGSVIKRDTQSAISSLMGKTFWEVEKELIKVTLDQYGGDKETTAKSLRISLKTLYNRLHSYS
jgi:DNA-binding NtrC family response regulator